MPRHARQLCALLVATTALLALAGPAAAAPGDRSRPATAAAPGDRSLPGTAAGVEAPTIDAINEARHERGLRMLRVSSQLAASASAQTTAMAEGGFFTHESSDGSPFWQRIARFYPSRGFSRWLVGENLLWASPEISPQRAVELWLESPSHRRILLNPAWTEIGLSAVHLTKAPGVFGGLEVTIVTADFGVRA
jgi:uncharacterized protein YkwD